LLHISSIRSIKFRVSKANCFRILFFFLFILLYSGCSPHYKIYKQSASLSPPEEIIYNRQYDDVWNTLQILLEKFPVLYSDFVSGIITTDYMPTYSYENMMYTGPLVVKKYGYFSYSFPLIDGYAIIVHTEEGSPAYGNLLPGDILVNYNKSKILESPEYLFKVKRRNDFREIILKKAEFKSNFGNTTVLQGKVRLNIRLKRTGKQKTHVKIFLIEEQAEVKYNPKTRAISIGESRQIATNGFKEILLKNILEDMLSKEKF